MMTKVIIESDHNGDLYVTKLSYDTDADVVAFDAVVAEVESSERRYVVVTVESPLSCSFDVAYHT